MNGEYSDSAMLNDAEVVAAKERARAIGYASRPDLRSRVAQQHDQAWRDKERSMLSAGMLGELRELLDKHPDVARILELIEKAGLFSTGGGGPERVERVELRVENNGANAKQP